MKLRMGVGVGEGEWEGRREGLFWVGVSVGGREGEGSIFDVLVGFRTTLSSLGTILFDPLDSPFHIFLYGKQSRLGSFHSDWSLSPRVFSGKTPFLTSTSKFHKPWTSLSFDQLKEGRLLAK